MMLDRGMEKFYTVLGRSRRSQVDIALNINGAVVNDNLSVANELNEYFKTVAVNLNREIPGCAVDPLYFNCYSTFLCLYAN